MLPFPKSIEWYIVSEAVNPRTHHYTQTTVMPVRGGGAVMRVTTMVSGEVTESMVYLPDVALEQTDVNKYQLQRYIVYSGVDTEKGCNCQRCGQDGSK